MIAFRVISCDATLEMGMFGQRFLLAIGIRHALSTAPGSQAEGVANQYDLQWLKHQIVVVLSVKGERSIPEKESLRGTGMLTHVVDRTGIHTAMAPRAICPLQ